MRKQMSLHLLFALLVVAACGGSRPDAWVCYFGPEVPGEKLEPYRLVILEPDEFKSVRHLSAPGKVAYLSVGECGTYRSYWPRVKDRPWAGAENPNWPGDVAVDIRSEEWRTILLDDAIPGIVQKGFNGLFLDTLNESIHDEIEGRPGSEGKIAALIGLLREIRRRNPGMTLIANSGLDILDRTAPHLDAVLVEDLATLYDFELKRSGPQSPAATAWMLDRLTKFQRDTRKPVYVIDYVMTTDTALMKASRDLCRQHGFSLYLAGIGLDEIHAY